MLVRVCRFESCPGHIFFFLFLTSLYFFFMKKLSFLFLNLLLFASFLFGQNHDFLLGIESSHGFSWSDKEDYQSRYINTLGLYFDYELLEGLYVGTGIGMNKVGHARERVEDYVVINFTGRFGLPFQRTYEGEIPTRRKSKYRFYQIPLRLNIRLLKTEGFEILLNNSISWNIYKDNRDVNWYWYKASNEVKTNNHHKVFGYKGNFLGFTNGLDFSKTFFGRIKANAGLQFHQLYFKTNFPGRKEQNRFSNFGVNLGLKYNFAREE